MPITQEISKEIEKLKKHIDIKENKKLIPVILSISRVLDKKITATINAYKKENNIKLTSLQKKEFRNILLGIEENTLNLPQIIEERDILDACKLINRGIERNKEKVLGTINAQLFEKKDHSKEYLALIKQKEKNENQLLILEVNSFDRIAQIKNNILEEYKNLSNYSYMGIIFNNSSWENIAEIALFCENLKQEKNFKLFNKQKAEKVEELCNFIQNNPNIKYTSKVKKAIEEFYKDISYGFQFNDLLISTDTTIKVLIFQKIELDESLVACPDCMSKEVRGNSYPRLLQKSFECQNPNCPSRSKIGRGKRYDYFSVKRGVYLKLYEKENHLDNSFTKQYRKDIFSNKKDLYKMLITFYSFSGDKVKILNTTKSINSYKRILDIKPLNKELSIPETIKLEKLLKTIIQHIDIQETKSKRQETTSLYSIYEGNSSNILGGLKEQIKGVITSPPYYNAREYSQWPNLICYLIDMAINAKAVLKAMQEDALYFYNIGDIVGQDNIYISSHMSTKRMLLGFLSILIFKLIGYELLNNLIWNKGEVQSKRNSTENLFPTYVRPINCYEHILVFAKKQIPFKQTKKLFDIDPVRKINSKGENILGHTAPFPEALVELIFPYVSKGYILDPYLGSGTTILTCIKNGYKSVGIELDPKYYDLCLNRIHKERENLFIPADLF